MIKENTPVPPVMCKTGTVHRRDTLDSGLGMEDLEHS